ncbi:MAG: hypothetical protein MUO81_08960 [Thermoplasmata archaeon]|nr:hypothetical protein [Thermoplasmata archaeon]
MRKVVVALLSAIVVGLMLVPSVSAGSKTVMVYDRQGDLGTAMISGGQGSHEWGDPLGWWSGESPIANAGYLDMLSEWVSVKGGTVTMGMTVASPVPTDGKLPEGVVEALWGWFFYQSIDVYYGGSSAPYAVYIVWDGADFSAVLVDRTSGTPPFDLTYLDFAVEGNVLTVTTSLASIAGAIAWFSETIILHGNPYPLDGVPHFGGWISTDLTDYQGPLAIYWPWQPMP